MRKQFQLSEEDEECLAALGLEWEAIVEGNTKWLIVHSYPIPDGYNHRQADAALVVLAGGSVEKYRWGPAVQVDAPAAR